MNTSSETTPKHESQLIDATLRGNQEAFGLLVRFYQNRLFNSVLQIVGCHAEAEEVVQEAFLQAYTKLASFRGASSFYTWLYRIAVNLALSSKRRKNIAAPDAAVSGSRELTDQTLSPVDQLVRQERGREVHKALARLTDHYRAILVLREFEGFNYQTIADVLGIGIGSVRSRLHRARVALRRELKTMDAERHGA